MNRTQVDRHTEGSAYATAMHVINTWAGARVLPVDGKHPVYTEVPHGSTDASNDPQQIAAWFSGTNYGVGVTGVLAIDGDDLDLTFEAFGDGLMSGIQIQGNPMRATFLFAQPEQPYGDGKHPGGEVKGSGYVVLPPSPHVSDDCASCANGPHPYVWINSGNGLPNLPPEIGNLLDTMVRRQGDRPTPIDAMPDGWLSGGVPCPAVTRLVEPLITDLTRPGVAKYPHVQAPLLALLRLGEQGHSGVLPAADRLRTAYIDACARESTSRARSAPSEFSRSLLGAAGRIHTEGLTDVYDRGCCATTTADPALDQRVFKSSSLMEHIYDYAVAAEVGPWAVLGSAMARAVAEVPPHVRLPPYVGGDASLNLYVALVDQSGAGKSAGHKAAEAAFVGKNTARLVPNGTGEGLLNSFLVPTPREDLKADPTLPRLQLHPVPQVLMYVDEIGQLTAGAGRNGGSTIEPILRSMWNAEHVGTNNAGELVNRNLPGHSYRLALVAGVQPGLAGGLLDQQAVLSGTAQRWTWLPVSNPFAPDEDHDRPAPRVWELTIPPGGVRYIHFPPYVREEVKDARRKVLRGINVSDADRVKGHAMLCQMKVAAALAVLHGELAVDDRLWAVAGDVMAKSDETRQAVIEGLAQAAGREAEKRGAAQFRTEAGKAQAASAAAERVAAVMWRTLTAHADGERHAPGCTRSCLTRSVSGRDTHLKDPAIEYAIDMGWMETVAEAGTLRYMRGSSRPF